MEIITLQNCINTPLPLNKLKAHPDNPRKDIGDLSELSESIKKHGLFQPLLVMKNDEDEDTYTILIGHRRAQAARDAGLQQVPCKVCFDDLDKQTQVLIMLEENMQRNDLTVYEQAESFQYCLDLGMSVEQVADKSGFSENTVRRRAKIAKLDKEVVKRQEEAMQLTIGDFDLLAQIKDVDLRNKILDEVRNRTELKSRVNTELSKIREKERFESLYIPSLVGIEPLPHGKSRWNGYKQLLQTHISDEGFSADDMAIIEKATGKGKKVYYERSWGTLYILEEIPEKKEADPNDPKEVAKKQAKERLDNAKAEIKKMCEDLKEMMIEHIKNTSVELTKGVKPEQELKNIKELFTLIDGREISTKAAIAGYKGIDWWRVEDKEIVEATYTLTEIIWYSMCRHIRTSYIAIDGKIDEKVSHSIMEIVSCLNATGFKLEKEYLEILTGLHPLYEVVAKKGKE